MKGGDLMGYSVKWIKDNLGITRDMLKYYEKEELISKIGSRNPVNNYREYSDDDIKKIWGIKLLTGIGFSAKEIKSFMYASDFDFDTEITKKVKELEQKHDKNVIYLEFARSIKLTGRIPNVSKIGNMRFDDFLAYAHKNWNFYDNPEIAPFMKDVDLIISKEPQEWNPEIVERILKMLDNINPEEMMYKSSLHGYCQVISDMKELGYGSEAVQIVVHLFLKYLIGHNEKFTELEQGGKITSQYLAKYVASSFLGGDVARWNERRYGKEGCLFIAQALAHYGGLEIEDL